MEPTETPLLEVETPPGPEPEPQPEPAPPPVPVRKRKRRTPRPPVETDRIVDDGENWWNDPLVMAAAALVIGIALAYLVEYLNRRIHDGNV